MGSSIFGFDHFGVSTPDKEDKKNDKALTEENRKLPIINPIVKLPNWPSKWGAVFLDFNFV